MEESVAWAEDSATDLLLPMVAAPKASFRERDFTGLGSVQIVFEAFTQAVYTPGRSMYINLRWRWQRLAFVAMAVLWVLFKINLLSTGWNVVAGLIITAVLYILLGFIGSSE
jgi:hypothetical protein